MEKSTFEVPVRVSGRVVYHITSESESKAAEIAIERAENADFGPLEDIDMEAMPAVTVRPAPEIQRQDRPEISTLMTLSTGHISLETFEQLMNESEDNTFGLCVYPKGPDFEFGLFLYLTEDKTSKPEFSTYPQDLQDIIRYTLDNNCTILCLDCDGPFVAGLKAYDRD